MQFLFWILTLVGLCEAKYDAAKSTALATKLVTEMKAKTTHSLTKPSNPDTFPLPDLVKYSQLGADTDARNAIFKPMIVNLPRIDVAFQNVVLAKQNDPDDRHRITTGVTVQGTFSSTPLKWDKKEVCLFIRGIVYVAGCTIPDNVAEVKILGHPDTQAAIGCVSGSQDAAALLTGSDKEGFIQFLLDCLRDKFFRPQLINACN